jgi:hypothetical protein
MIKMSQYMNSMQELYEEFGQSFESIRQQYHDEYKRVIARTNTIVIDVRLCVFVNVI